MGPLIPLILGVGGGYYLSQKAAQQPTLRQGPAQSDSWWNDWRAIGAIGAVALGATSTDRDTREAFYVIGAGLGGAAAAGHAFRMEAEATLYGGQAPQPQPGQIPAASGGFRPIVDGREMAPPAPGAYPAPGGQMFAQSGAPWMPGI